jgi:2-phosphoglycerate kinase
VAAVLEERFGLQFRRAYETKPFHDHDITVRNKGREGPFSVGILIHSLEACAIDPETALEGARKVQETLQNSGHRTVDHKVLRRIIYRCLKTHCSVADADRYLSWREFKSSGRPLIVLVGGATGTGKSTVTSELAYRLDVVRTQSTDMMRQIIRCYLAPHVVPTLAYSSFEAWRGLLPTANPPGKRATDNPVVAGFLSQFATVKVAVEATISRAVKERHHLIIDGVHVLPTELDLVAARADAIVVPVMLAILSKQALAKQLINRGGSQPERMASRYVDHLDDIWELQYYLLSLADTAGIPIIPNDNVEDTVRELIHQVSREIATQYPANPDALESDQGKVTTFVG